MCTKNLTARTTTTKPNPPPLKIHKIHTPRNRPPHSTLISQWFGLSRPTLSRPSLAIDLPQPTPGHITLITGPSGSGKSSLLRLLRRRSRIPIINIASIPLAPGPVINLFHHISIESALATLSRVGLAEAHCYLADARRLSDGQRWRLRLALALSTIHANSGQPLPNRKSKIENRKFICLLADEFTTLLDRVTAAVVARVLRRAITPDSNLCAIIATGRDDILRALDPDTIIRCDFGQLQLLTKGRNLCTPLASNRKSKIENRKF